MQMLQNPGSSGDKKKSPKGTAELEQVVSIIRLHCAEALMVWEAAADVCLFRTIVPLHAQATRGDKSYEQQRYELLRCTFHSPGAVSSLTSNE